MSLYAGITHKQAAAPATGDSASTASGSASPAPALSASPAPPEAADKPKCTSSRRDSHLQLSLTLSRSSHLVCSSALRSSRPQKGHQARDFLHTFSLHRSLRFRRGIQCTCSQLPSHRRACQSRFSGPCSSSSQRSLRQRYLYGRASLLRITYGILDLCSADSSCRSDPRATPIGSNGPHARSSSADDAGR